MRNDSGQREDRYSDEDWAALQENWQPAVIAPSEYVLKFHKVDPRAVTRYAGQVVRIRRNEDADNYSRASRWLMLGCRGEGLELHAEDAKRLFPDIEERVTLCTCYLLMD
jgi:hypothetical protein